MYSGPYIDFRLALADDATVGIFWARKVQMLQKRYVYEIDLIDI